MMNGRVQNVEADLVTYHVRVRKAQVGKELLDTNLSIAGGVTAVRLHCRYHWIEVHSV